jgi:Lar family restriction alleviation protein
MKLKPCPFCGSKEIEVDDDGYYEWVICADCYSSTGKETWIVNGIHSEAIDAWNLRYTEGDDK